MGMLKSLNNFKNQFGCSAGRKRAAAEQVLQGPAIHILHDQELVSIGVRQDRVDRHNADVAHLGRGAASGSRPKPGGSICSGSRRKTLMATLRESFESQP